MINVYVVKGENFPDIKSDIYVTCEFSPQSLNKIISFGKTQSVRKTHNPVWDNLLQYPFTPPVYSTKNIEFIFTVHDHGNPVGKAIIELDSKNEIQIGKLVPISFSCKNAKNDQKSILYVQFESNFTNLKDIEPFKFEKHSYIYCYYTHENPQQYGVMPDLSFLIISKDDPEFAKNFKEFNSNDISLSMNPIDNRPTKTGKSQLLSFNLKKSPAIYNYVFVPILVSIGYSGSIALNFAYISTKSNSIVEKLHLGAKYRMIINKERTISFPIAFTFDHESKVPLFFDVTTVNASDCNSDNDFLSRVKNNALLASSDQFKQNLYSIKNIASLFKIDYPNAIHVSFVSDKKTDHSISAAAYTEDFALIGRISSVSNHSDLENALSYTYITNENDQSEFKRNELFINLKTLVENFENVGFVLIVVTSPSNVLLQGQKISIQIDNSTSHIPLLTFRPKKIERCTAWMPIILHKNNDQFDIITMEKYFESPKPFEAQILMKNFLRNNNDLNRILNGEMINDNSQVSKLVRK